MRKISILFAAAILFALTWAAGHDILKGEQNVWMEYLVVVTGLLLAVFLLAAEIKKLARTARRP